MVKDFGEGKKDSIALDQFVVPTNLALLEHRIPTFFPTMEELIANRIKLDDPLCTPVLFWYFDHERLLEGQIIDVVPIGLIDEVERLNQAYAMAIDLGFMGRGELTISSQLSFVEERPIEREYSIDPTGYFERFQGRDSRIRDNSERRLYQTRERFNALAELRGLKL